MAFHGSYFLNSVLSNPGTFHALKFLEEFFIDVGGINFAPLSGETNGSCPTDACSKQRYLITYSIS